MHVFLSVVGRRTSLYRVYEHLSVQDFVERIVKRENIPSYFFYLVHGGKVIRDGTFADHQIQDESTIYLCGRLK